MEVFAQTGALKTTTHGPNLSCYLFLCTYTYGICVHTFVHACTYIHVYTQYVGLPGGSEVKNLSAKQEMQVRFLGGEDALEKEMATHSCILA